MNSLLCEGEERCQDIKNLVLVSDIYQAIYKLFLDMTVHILQSNPSPRPMFFVLCFLLNKYSTTERYLIYLASAPIGNPVGFEVKGSFSLTFYPHLMCKAPGREAMEIASPPAPRHSQLEHPSLLFSRKGAWKSSQCANAHWNQKVILFSTCIFYLWSFIACEASETTKTLGTWLYLSSQIYRFQLQHYEIVNILTITIEL